LPTRKGNTTREPIVIATSADENQTDRRREMSAALWRLYRKHAAIIMKTPSRHSCAAEAQS